MNKYILDSIRNHARSITNTLTKPQRKCILEIIRALFVASEPILRHLALNDDILVKKQAERYSHHLGNVDLADQVDQSFLKKISKFVKNKTIIAYDLTDINKECARIIENISRVFDGSKRKVQNGFTLHAVGINNVLVKLRLHNHKKYTLNQIRLKIVKEISSKLKRKGIWVFDRGNDDKQFFKQLHHILKVKFICRVRSNRMVVLHKTGVKTKVNNLPPGKYKIYLMTKYNTKVDKRKIFTLIISQQLEDKQPIRLITNLPIKTKNVVNMYLERWGVESTFKRVKEQFGLEKIRVLKYIKFQNLVSLIQFVANTSAMIYANIQKETNILISDVLVFYKRFLKHKNLTSNVNSFISYLKFSLKSLKFYKIIANPQLTLLPKQVLEKLGSF